MKCPFCGGLGTKVTDKRDSDSEESTRRRRECLECKRRFTTYEKPDIEIIVIKKNGSRVPYNRDKVLLGIVKACEKREVSHDKIDNIIEEIEERLRKKGKEVESKLIGELVMKALKKLDKVAYIRFASVYREFQDINDFKKEIKEVS